MTLVWHQPRAPYRLHLPLHDQLLDRADRLRRVQRLRARVGTVHNRVAAIQLERVLQRIQSLARVLVA
jgi:hypothetical protein